MSAPARMPALFIGHGNPMNALEDNATTQAWRVLAATLPPPRAGNLVHNLHANAWGRQPAELFDWAVRFESYARARIAADDPAPLVDYEALGRDAALSVPTPEHYLPLLVVLGARHQNDGATFPVEGIDGGSISMLSLRLGAQDVGVGA